MSKNISALLLLTFSLVYSNASWGQVASPDPVPVTTSPPFAELIQTAAQKAQVTVLIEGTPLVAEKAKAALSQDISSLPPLAALTQIANAVDYEVLRERPALRRRPNVLVLQKRYTNPQDLPTATPAECLEGLKEFEQAASQQMPHPPVKRVHEVVLSIFQSLTPDQRHELEANTLKLTTLRPEQRSEVDRMVRHIYLADELTESAQPKFLLQKLSQFKLRLHEVSASRYEIICDYLQEPKGQTRSLVLTMVNPLQIAQSQKEISSAQSDKSDEITMAELLARLKNGTAASQQVTTEYSIDAPLLDKPVSVYNLTASTPPQVLYALADLYGLHILAPDNATIRLTPPRVRAANELTEIPVLMRRTMPNALLRAFHDEERSQLEQTLAPTVLKSMQATADVLAERERQKSLGVKDNQTLRKISHEIMRLGDEQEAINRRRDQLSQYSEQVRDAAAAYLYRSLKSKQTAKEVASGENGTSPALSLQEERAFTTIVMQPFMENMIGHFSAAIPNYVAHSNIVYLTGREYERNGKMVWTIDLSVRLPDGKMWGEAGIEGFDPTQK